MRRNFRALLLFISLSLFLSACGGSPNTTEDNNIKLACTAWESEYINFFFYDDGSVEVFNEVESAFGQYEWLNNEGKVSYEDVELSLKVDEAGDLYFEDETGASYLMNYVGIAEGRALAYLLVKVVLVRRLVSATFYRHSIKVLIK